MTPRQQAIYDYIVRMVQTNHRSPTIREIGRDCGISSPNGAMTHIRALERDGHIRRRPGARGIEITNAAPKKKSDMDVTEAIQLWVDAHEEHGNFETRRYPPCISELDGVVAIADEDDNGSNLTMWKEERFIEMMTDALRHVKDNPDDDLLDGIYLSTLKPDWYESH